MNNYRTCKYKSGVVEEAKYRPLATKCILAEFFSMENAFDVEYIGIIQKAIKNE